MMWVGGMPSFWLNSFFGSLLRAFLPQPVNLLASGGPRYLLTAPTLITYDTPDTPLLSLSA